MTSDIDLDLDLPDMPDPHVYAKAQADAMIRFHKLADEELPESTPFDERLNRYNDMINAVKEYAELERRFMLRTALRLCVALDRLDLIPKDRIAHKVCYQDLREYLNIEGGNKDSYVSPKWLVSMLPAEYRSKK